MSISNRFSGPKRKDVSEFKPGPVAVQSHLAEGADVNAILKKMRVSPMSYQPGPKASKPMFGDFTNLDLMNMKNTVIDIENKFLALPGKTRSRFGNDVYQMMRWLQNPENSEQAIKMGLLPASPTIDLNQVDLLDIANAAEAAQAAEAVLKADPEAQPDFKKPAKDGGT